MAQIAVSVVMICGVAALAVDLGMVYVARTEIQLSADSAALAGAWKLLDEDRVLGGAAMAAVVEGARHEVAAYGYKNPVRKLHPEIPLNLNNSPSGEIVIGRLDDPTNPAATMTFESMTTANAVQVRVRRDEEQNGPVGMFFARVIGKDFASVSGRSTAAFEDCIVGFELPAGSDETVQLLPFALRKVVWDQYMEGTLNGLSDGFSYSSGTKSVSAGSDGILELNLYPGAGAGQLSPGNFGTVDLGAPNNSTKDVARQILHGLNSYDLSFFGGKIQLNDQGFLMLNGDTGLSAGIKDELAAIKGQPRVIPLFDEQSGPGNNAMFRIVGWAGIRIVDVRLTGAMNSKRLLIQPAVVADKTAISKPGTSASEYVYRPPSLVR